MERLNVAIADDNDRILELLGEIVSSDKELTLVGKANNGEEMYQIIKNKEPDVVLLDLIMPKMDGLSVMERVNEDKTLKKSPNFIIITAVGQERITEDAFKKGASYYIMKPFHNETVLNRIKHIQNEVQNLQKEKIKTIDYTGGMKEISLENRVTDMIHEIGIPAHIKGYHFLREAVKLAVTDPEIISSITKRLYPTIAEKFATSPSKVERGMRHAIEVAWNRGKIENINNLFGLQIYGANEKPTNGELIALIADKMLMEG